MRLKLPELTFTEIVDKVSLELIRREFQLDKISYHDIGLIPEIRVLWFMYGGPLEQIVEAVYVAWKTNKHGKEE